MPWYVYQGKIFNLLAIIFIRVKLCVVESKTMKIIDEGGSILIIILFMVTIIGLSAAVTGTSWKTICQKSKEEELLWIGNEYRKAIESYYSSAHGGMAPSYPSRLDDLLLDPRSPSIKRHIRKLYKDPITGEDFDVILENVNIDGKFNSKFDSGRIIGVKSKSLLEPFKKDGFSSKNKAFKNAKSYTEWEFKCK